MRSNKPVQAGVGTASQHTGGKNPGHQRTNSDFPHRHRNSAIERSGTSVRRHVPTSRARKVALALIPPAGRSAFNSGGCRLQASGALVACNNGKWHAQFLLVIGGKENVEASAAIEIAKHTLLSGGLILAIGTITGLLAQKIRIPDVAVFLIVGMVIGPEALGLINIKADSALNQIILLFGASYILFDGGASLRFSVLKQVWITIVVIATVGVVITAAITGIAAYYVLGVPCDRGVIARRDACLDRPGDAGSHFSAGPHSRPRGANGDERIRRSTTPWARSSPSACWPWRWGPANSR